MSTYDRFYAVVRRVPLGRVTTYGTVAAEAGLPGRARQVGYALAALPDAHEVPWHRVVNARGEISGRAGGDSFERIQRALLESEGVHFDARGRIDLDRFGWPADPAGSHHPPPPSGSGSCPRHDRTTGRPARDLKSE